MNILKVLSMGIKNVLICILLVSLCVTGCKNSQSDNKNSGQSGPLQGEWYRRYTGTIADRKVVVNLHHYGGATAGSFYYINNSEVVNLTESEDTVDKFSVHFNEQERSNRNADDDNYKPARWSINFTDKEVNGKWASGDNSKTFAIDLKEEYPAGSSQLNVMMHADSTAVKKGITNTVAVSSYELLQPTAGMKKEDADFFIKTILHLLGADTLGAKTTADYIKKEDKKYFDNYKRLLEDIKIDRETNDEWRYNFYHSRNTWVLYNDKGMLSLQLHQYDYSGGSGHGNYWSAYTCVDMQQKKVWQLNDIISDAGKLLPILNNKARSIFKVAAKDTLANRLKVSEVPMTDNIFITDKGITFCYYPGEIGADDFGEICLFIPYTDLKGILKDDFSKRMGL